MSGKNWGRISDILLQDASALAPGVTKRTIFGAENGMWEDYVMRHFTLPAGESIPLHTHDWDHLVISLEGHGSVEVEGEVYDLPSGSWARVKGGRVHSFKNNGEAPFVFICIVPTHGDPHAKKASMRASREYMKKKRSGS